jgi:hypothetical protein
MPDLGKKYECFNCRTKFYNLGKPEAICPKCGANQKDARSDEAPPPPPLRPPRRSVIMEPIPEENTNEFGEEVTATEEEEGEDEEEFEGDEEVEGEPPNEEEY